MEKAVVDELLMLVIMSKTLQRGSSNPKVA
jgi:hypothetical protein